jgi:hypothetical protein
MIYDVMRGRVVIADCKGRLEKYRPNTVEKSVIVTIRKAKRIIILEC